MPNEDRSDQLLEGWMRAEVDMQTGILLSAESVTEVPLRFLALRDALFNIPATGSKRPYHVFYGPAIRLPADHVAASRRHLGIPDDLEPFMLGCVGNEVTTIGTKEKKVKSQAEQWDGYLLQMIGTAADTSDPSGLVAAWHPGIEGAPLMYVQVWLAIATYKTSPLRLDMRWQPDRGERISIRGLEKGHRARDRERAYKAISFIRTVTEAGRPRKLTEDDVQRIRTAARKYPKVMRDAGSRRFSKRDFAESVGCDVKTLRTFMSDYQIPWPKISPQ